MTGRRTPKVFQQLQSRPPQPDFLAQDRSPTHRPVAACQPPSSFAGPSLSLHQQATSSVLCLPGPDSTTHMQAADAARVSRCRGTYWQASRRQGFSLKLYNKHIVKCRATQAGQANSWSRRPKTHIIREAKLGTTSSTKINHRCGRPDNGHDLDADGHRNAPPSQPRDHQRGG